MHGLLFTQIFLCSVSGEGLKDIPTNSTPRSGELCSPNLRDRYLHKLSSGYRKQQGQRQDGRGSIRDSTTTGEDIGDSVDKSGMVPAYQQWC